MRKSISFSPFTKGSTQPFPDWPKPCTEVSASDSEPPELASRPDSSWRTNDHVSMGKYPRFKPWFVTTKK